jgi:hypothetical protein
MGHGTTIVRILPTRKTDNQASGNGLDSRTAAGLLRVIMFAVPAAFGFVIAYAILAIMGPFATTFELIAWFGIAVAVSWITSIFIGDGVRTQISKTSLYRRANTFDTDVEELFGSSLREGNVKAVKREAVTRGLDADFIDHVLLLLDQLGRHERLTRGHSERVRAYASLIGKEIGLSDDDLESLNWTALLHDIGKLDVPSWILTTTEAPSPEEWEVMKRHPETAKPRLRRLEATLGESIYEGALYHHEWWDGSGYPHHLSAGEIPLFGRITAIADAFDVMTHARSYKKPLPIAHAREEMLSVAGTQFDPELVAAFVHIGDEDLKKIRGWSATIAGFSVAGSRMATVGSQAVIVAATVAGAGISSAVAPSGPPPAIAFEPPATTRAPQPEITIPVTSTTTTLAAPTSTITTTTTIAPTTTAPRLMSLNYRIGDNHYDGVAVTVDADRVDVFLDGELNQTIDIEIGTRDVIVVLDVTDLAPGVHTVQFDLFLADEQLSSDQISIVV